MPLQSLVTKVTISESNSRLISLKKHPNPSINKKIVLKKSKIALNLPLTKLSAKGNHRESNFRLITLKKYPNTFINKDFGIKKLKNRPK